jgi:protein O-GlcNAc transferase
MINLAFITGCGHTGSTLLARIIGEHSQIFLPLRETNIFLAYNALIHNALLEKEILNAKSIKPHSIYFIEKTPRHIWHVDYIRRVTKDSKFIFSTRDGFDVIASLYKRNHNISESIRRYKDDSLLTIRQLDQTDSILIKYEDIIFNTNEEVTKICKFLNLKFEKDMLNYHQTQVSWNEVESNYQADGAGEISHDKLRSWQANQPIYQNTLGWKEIIPNKYWDEVIDFFDKSGNEIMKSLGY